MADEKFYNNSIFWVEVDKIQPNPYQPRHEFDEARLRDLSESIRQYGVLQPLVVTRHETMHEETGLSVTYELIAGERRLRASKLAGLSQVPVIIRSGEEQSRMKLELAIIENLQREDLNPMDRALAFSRLVEEFKFKHVQVAQKVGKSREYVSNSIRLLGLPEEIREAVRVGKVSEGHTRPLLMLTDRPQEQNTLYKEILYKRLTVREAESIARRVAQDKVRKKEFIITPEVIEIEGQLTETLGTRVQIEQREVGGKITIDYFSSEDLRSLIDLLQQAKAEGNHVSLLHRFIEQLPQVSAAPVGTSVTVGDSVPAQSAPQGAPSVQPEAAPVDDRSSEEKQKEETEEIYSIKNFSI